LENSKEGIISKELVTQMNTIMNLKFKYKNRLKAGCSVFNAGCNKQVLFCPKPCKKIGADPSCHFREKRKNEAL